nr:hypothetical protein [Tanacetum cinerariifolium]
MRYSRHKVDEYHNDMPLIYYVEGHSLHFGRPEFAVITDSVRLCLILALEVIFMGMLLACPVDDSLFGLVENFKAWNVFPWGEHVWTQLYGSIKNVAVKHSDTHYLGLNKDHNYVPIYTLTGFVFAFQIWTLESFERSNHWWINAPQVIPRAMGWSKKLKTRRLTDRVIRELNVRVFKLEIIIQVLTLERNDKLGRLQFNEDLSRLEGDFVESLNILFQDLVNPHDLVEDIANEYLVDEELKLCLKEEERIRLEQEKRIQQEKRLRLEEEKMLQLEEEKMLQITELYLLALSANSLLVKDMMVKLFEIDNERDLRTVVDTYAMCQQLHLRCHERREQMLKMQSFLHVPTSLAESYKLFEELQDFELEKCRDLMKLVSETQLKVLKKLSFIAKLHRQTNEKPENYFIFEVNYDGVFNLHPLRYDHGKILTLKLSKLIRTSFSKLLDMLSYKLEYEIWGIFYSTPRSILEEGLTIVRDDFDMNKMYDMGENVADELGLHDNWLYEGLSLDGPIDVGGPIPLDSVGANLQVVLKKKKKGRSMVKGVYYPSQVAIQLGGHMESAKRSVNFLCGEVRHAIMNIDHLNGLIEMMEVMEFTLEIYDSAWCLREMIKAENKRILGLNKHLVDAEEDIKAKEGLSLDEGGFHGLMYFGLINDSTLSLLEVYYAKLFSLMICLSLMKLSLKYTKNGVFEFDPLRYENGVVYSVSTFTCDRDIFHTCLDWILYKISEEKWALFYCLPNKQLEHGLKLIHTDNDVHSFFADAELNGRPLIGLCDKGIEKMDEFLAATPTKEHQVVVTNYNRAIVNGKAKMVEVVAHVQENIDVGIKQEDRKRKNVLGLMAPYNFVKNHVVSTSMGQGSSVKVC